MPKPDLLQTLNRALLAAGATSEAGKSQPGKPAAVKRAKCKGEAGKKLANGHVQSIIAHGETFSTGLQNGGTHTVHVNGFNHDPIPSAEQQVSSPAPSKYIC